MLHNSIVQNHSQAQFHTEDHKLLSMKRAEELENRFKQIQPELPDGFFFSNDKLMYLQTVNSPDQKPSQPVFICSKLEVVAYIRDDNNENYGKLLVFKDPEQQIHEWPMPMELIAGDGTKYRAALLSRGLEISMNRSAQSLLSIYLATSQPSLWIRCVRRLGWNKNNFVLPSEVIGPIEKEKLIFQNHSIITPNYTQKGTVNEWIDNVARLCKKNSRLEFAVSSSFASPLLTLLKAESGGAHFRGPSSIGKSKILKAASSVWSDELFIQSWNATINGLEAIASGYNDSLLCLDEIAQIDSMIVGGTVYLLFNEKSKRRANQLGIGCDSQHWKIIALSTGEISVEEHGLQSGKKTKAGQEIRMIDIPADTGKYGCFEELHEHTTGAEFADALSNACNNYYGSVSRAYLINITNDLDFAIHFAEKILKEFIEKNQPLKASGEVSRVLKRLAIIAAGGELATEFGLTGWEKGAAMLGVARCFSDWLIARGGVGNYEELRALKHIHMFFSNNSHRFENWDTVLDKDVAEEASFKKFDRQGNIEFFVHRSLFDKVISIGHDPTSLAQLCIKKGLLLPSTDNKSTRSESVSINKVTSRFYRFTSKVLELNLS
jgi:putative DNA primase/helicase